MGRSGAIDMLGADLAARLPLLGLVLVPAVRQARVLWHDGPPDPAKLDALIALGREHLRSDTPEAGPAKGTVFGFTLRHHGGPPPAVVLAVRSNATAWTDADRALLTSKFTLARDDLLALAGRPNPPQRTAGPALEDRIRAAVRDGELVLLYQPEVDLRCGEVLAVEALLRWDHPVLGRLEPHAFIPIAERSDLIKVLGTWVIERALTDLAAWQDDRITMRINVSPAQIAGDDVVRRLERALADHGVPGKQVCIEFTETDGSIDDTELAGTLPGLARLGVSTALDDLATGYSTLSRLRSLPVDAIKIDRSLVVGIDGDARARAIVRSLLQLGADLDLDVVAEGIENAAEAQTLRELGCLRGQGHHFARPQETAAIAQLLRTSSILVGGGQARAESPPFVPATGSSS